MHTRICTQVCTFLEMISKDGMCCLLRLTPSRVALLAHTSLCCPSSPSAHLPPPPLPLSILCVLLYSPVTPLLSSPLWPCIVQLSPRLMVLSFRTGVNEHFFAESQIVNMVGFVCCAVSVATTHLSCCSMKTDKGTISANGPSRVPTKLYFQNHMVDYSWPPDSNLPTFFSEHAEWQM